MKKVLLLAYHFPPSNAVGALRPAKFAQYLPEFGWEPVVLRAPAEGGGGGFSGDRDTMVDTVSPWPGPREILVSLRGGNGGSDGPASAGAGPAKGRLYEAAAAGRRGPRQVARSLLMTAMWVPDDRQGWIPPAVARGLQLAQKTRPAAVLATSPPASACLTGAIIARICGIPFICDLRDPWCGNPFRGSWYHEGLGRRVDCRLEGWALRAAESVLVATTSHGDLLADRHELQRDSVVTLENGFDPSDFEGLVRSPADRFTITYAGNLYANRSPEPLFRALARLREDNVVEPSEVCVELVGDPATDIDVREMAEAAGFEDSLSLTGRVPYHDALQRLVSSDLLLLLADGQPDQIPTKAYEYLAAGPPLLTIGDAGATADLVRRSGRGACFAPDQVDAMADFLRRMMSRDSTGPGTWACPDDVTAWDRRRQAGRLADLLSRATSARCN